MSVDNPFQVLVNEKLSSVVFVMDYLQLDFDGNRLSCYEWPTIVLSNSKFLFGHAEYRNALCSRIAKEVNNTTLIDDEIFEIDFGAGMQIKFDLKNAMDEVIFFTPSEGNWSSI